MRRPDARVVRWRGRRGRGARGLARGRVPGALRLADRAVEADERRADRRLWPARGGRAVRVGRGGRPGAHDGAQRPDRPGGDAGGGAQADLAARRVRAVRVVRVAGRGLGGGADVPDGGGRGAVMDVP